jgi:hypothetical protein
VSQICRALKYKQFKHFCGIQADFMLAPVGSLKKFSWLDRWKLYILPVHFPGNGFVDLASSSLSKKGHQEGL